MSDMDGKVDKFKLWYLLPIIVIIIFVVLIYNIIKNANNSTSGNNQSNNNKPVVVRVEGNVNEWTNQNIILNVVATKAQEEITGYSFDDGKNWQSSNKKEIDKNGSYYIKVKDAKNNISEARLVVVNKIDKEGPVITVSKETTIPVGSSMDLRHGVKVTDSLSGMNATFTVTPSTIDTTKANTYTVTYEAIDNVGNKTSINRRIIVIEE